MNFKKIEEKWQAKWEELKIYEANQDNRKKYFMVFAYPTVSGTLHVGHARSYVLPDVIARYKRMRGFNVFFPIGFHATGLGCQKILNDVEKDLKNAKLYGISPKDAVKFKNPLDVEKYLEKIMIKAFKKIGLSLDYRAVVSTIDAHYNKFIQWQFKKLKNSGYLIQKDYRLPWCPDCDHPVSLDSAEMDIQEWSGAQIKDFIVIKFKQGKTIFPAATMRPETVFGVTNIWVNPNGRYVKAQVDNEEWIISENAVEKLKYLEKNVKILEELAGEEFLNQKVFNPATNKEVPILAGDFVDMDEATGIVMSVPSHDPFDYIYLNKVAPDIKPIQVVKSPGFGEIPAKEILEKYGIKYHQDPKIKDATNELYKIEFYGKMLDSIPMFGGMQASKAKNEVTNWLKRTGNADMMYELSVKPIHCRCGSEVVIKLVKGQWFIDYGNIKLKELAKKCIENMNFYPPEYKKELPPIIDWLEARPCVRKRGLGTRFPFEEDWIIEALSDSTIYMAFYIVSKYFNLGEISLNDITDEFFDYVFLSKGKAKNECWEKIRNEFLYWYPLDLNAGGKEHKAAHFPLFIMNHVAIFPENLWPKGIFVNWHLIAYGKKLSKHLGNVVFWDEAIDNYGADTLRLYIAHGANQWEDFDWKNEECEIYKKHLENFYKLFNKFLNKTKTEKEHIDRWLESRINRTVEAITNALEKNEIKKAANFAFFTILNDVQWYKKRSKKINLDFLKTWLKLLTPFIPHTCEELWSKLGNEKSIIFENWPNFNPELIRLKEEAAEEELKRIIRDVEEIKRLSKITTPTKITIFVAPTWKYEVYNDVLQGLDVKEIIAKHKGLEKEVSAYISKLKKKRITEELFLKGYELKHLEESKDFLEKELKCKIKIIPAEKSDHPKALIAEPEKPGILIE
ncbi:MAG: leucine--tRNA ligase [Candidatus Aenigmatarchaeota archaeon]